MEEYVMAMIANYHTHTLLCGHASGMVEDYVLEAIRQGFEEIGISDHGPIPYEFMSLEDYYANEINRQMNMPMFNEIYLPGLETAIKKYGHLIKILKAVEIEYLSGHEEFYRSLLLRLDYLSLGVHYFKAADKIYNSYFPMSGERIIQYAEAVSEALSTGYFTILNHPDLYLMSYRDGDGMSRFDEAAAKAARIIIEAAIRNDVYLEINGGGPRRGRFTIEGKTEYLYPRSEFWKLVEEYPAAKVIIGCDSHNPADLYDSVIKDVEIFAKAFRFRIINKIDINTHPVR